MQGLEKMASRHIPLKKIKWRMIKPELKSSFKNMETRDLFLPKLAATKYSKRIDKFVKSPKTVKRSFKNY